ncbi:MAG: D-2-hydroxyacid dehydrogenase [Campylobacteraceae bacterium]|nr:D-2-hydroxyacid dehydrogenase [Campylobacteraceae bacterium]
MKLAILDAKTLGKDANLERFSQFGVVSCYATTTQDELLERLEDVEVVIVNKVKIGREIMKSSPKLKLICLTATGMDNIDLEAAKDLGVIVKNVAGYSTFSVAQHTFALVLELLNSVSYYDKFVKNDGWAKSSIFTHIDKPIHEIYNKNWGIIGLGEIGKTVAKIASAFGAKVSYYSTSGKNINDAYPHVQLKELLTKSDIITIHAPLNSKTKSLIGEKELAYMRKNALLVNVGRGGIIDELALKKTLEAEHIYAGLDVLEEEPMSLNSPLRKLEHKERLVITPHIAWASIEARQVLMEEVAKNIKTYLEEK